eukprot:scaffold159751_cov31-Attheya_sp.AAC.1
MSYRSVTHHHASQPLQAHQHTKEMHETRRRVDDSPRKYNEGQPDDLSNEALGRCVRYYTPILDHLFSSTITFSNKEKAFSVRDGNFVSGAESLDPESPSCNGCGLQ